MYRLLIVDDEAYIVDWISEIMEVQLGIELEIYRAYSAFEALKISEAICTYDFLNNISVSAAIGLTDTEKMMMKLKIYIARCKHFGDI